jgi:hypothetical protein
MVWVLISMAVLGAGDEAQAKVHYRAGKTHFDLKNYSEAIREFAAGYALSPKPEFLINLAQAYKRNGEAQKALEMFERYLERAPADAAERRSAEEVLGELRKAVAAQQPPPDAPVREPPPPVATAPSPGVVLVQEPSKGVSPLAWAIPLGVAVVAGAVVGIVFATQAVSCSGAGQLGCVDLRGR